MISARYWQIAGASRGQGTADADRTQFVFAALPRLCFAVLGMVFLLPGAFWGQTEVERGRGLGAGAAWVPAVQQEWETFGREYFQSVAADKPHATLLLRDSATRAGVGPFDIWLLIDGALVKGWTKAGDVRISPGPHCIRVEMVSVPQRYQGTLGRFWPWVTGGSEDEVRFSGDSKAGFTAKYQRIKFIVKPDTLIDPKQLEFDRNQPRDREAAYAYCLEHVRKQRSQ